MIDAYEVGVSLVMNNQILRSISEANEAMSTLTNTIMGANAALKRMNSYTQNLVDSANSLRTAWQGVANAINTASNRAGGFGNGGGGGRGGGRGGGGSSGGGGAGSSSGGGVPMIYPGSYARYTGSSAGGGYLILPGSGLPVPLPGGAGGGGGRLGGGAGGGLIGGGGGGLTSPGRGGGFWYGGGGGGGGGVGGGGGGRGGFNPGPPSPSDYAITGAAAGTVGYGILGFIGDSVKQAASLQATEAYMRAAQWTPDQIKQAENIANSVRINTPGSSLQGNMQLLYELKSVFGSAPEAMDNLQTIVRQSIVANETGQGANYEAAFEMARAGELSAALNNPVTGQLDANKFVKFMDSISTVSLMTAGRVNASDYVAMAQNAGAGVMSQLNDNALFTELPALMLGMGGARTGTALNALAQQFKGGKMSQYAARAMHDIGLLPDYMFGSDDKILKKYRYGIGMAALPPGAIPNGAEYNADPIKWLYDTVIPAMQKHGITSQADEENYLYKMMSRVPGIRLDQDAIANILLVKKYEDQMRATNGHAAYATIAQMDPQLQMMALSQSLTALEAAAGRSIMPVAIEMINDLTNALNFLGNEAQKHPRMAQDIMEFAGVLGVAAIGLSAFSLSVFAFGPAVRVLWSFGEYLPFIMRGLGLVLDVALGIAGLGTGLTEVAAAILGIGLAIAALKQWFPSLFSAAPAAPANHQGQHYQQIGRYGAWVNNAPPTGSKDHETMAQEAHAALTAIHAWISGGAPTNANVTNAGAISSATAARVLRQGGGPSTGATGYNPRATPSGSAAMQTHGRS